MSDCFIVYSQVLDCFIKVRKLSPDELGDIFSDLDDKILDPDFKIEQFIKYINKRVINNYTSLARRFDEVSVFCEAVYECVTEVYPMLTAETACAHYNVSPDGASSKRPVASYGLSEISSIKKKISKNIIGQDGAVGKAVDLFKLMNSGFESFGSLFFIGPTGVGKTELGRQIANEYLKNPKRLLKINCAEYANQHEYAKLIGSPPGYIGSNEKSILLEKAEQSSQWVILFDEIEKANSKLHNLLLALLDEGKIMDNHGNELNFSDSIFIFTSNVGLKDLALQGRQIGFGDNAVTYSNSRDSVTEAFKREFSPEFINRIDEIVYFNELSREDVEKIVKLNLQNLPIKITKRLVSYVVNNSYSKEYGARNIKRFIKQNVTLQLADKILEGVKSEVFKPVFKNNVLEVEGIV